VFSNSEKTRISLFIDDNSRHGTMTEDRGHWARLTGDKPARPDPPNDRQRQLWRVQAPSGRIWECATYRVATGIEIRIQTEGKDDPVWTQLFRSDGDDLAVVSESWRSTLLAKGFTELQSASG
jgi:hypothetical protein